MTMLFKKRRVQQLGALAFLKLQQLSMKHTATCLPAIYSDSDHLDNIFHINLVVQKLTKILPIKLTYN